MEFWSNFKGQLWKKEINVRDFIQENYTPYHGDDSFLVDSTEKTKKVWNKLTEMFKVEREKGIYDAETKFPQGIVTYGPGYIDKDSEVIVGLQTDAPLKRGIFPKGGLRMVKNSLEAYGYKIDPLTEEIFTKYRKTHNEGVFSAYTDEIKAARKSGIITGLPDAYGSCKCLISGDWPDKPGRYDKNPKLLDVLMEYDPELHADWLTLKGKMKQPVVYALRDSWSNNDYYSEPVWLPAYILGWVEIAHLVPRFLQKAYKNQITWKWHVQIPYSYWDKQFPEQDYESVEARQKAIQKSMDDIERNLCGTENAEKPLFTHYAVNEANGKIEEEWKITALDNKYKGGENLVTSAAANSEILFALLVNPNVFGAGMPGGTYAGNQGGSNIREAFLVNIANAWIDRQNLLDPVKIYLKSHGYDDVELRFRNTVLTTLDSGAGTQKTLS